VSQTLEEFHLQGAGIMINTFMLPLIMLGSIRAEGLADVPW